jgi:fumarylpyruvate hydrolase
MLRFQRILRAAAPGPASSSGAGVSFVHQLPIVTVPIFGAGRQVFPVRRVYCVGQNYASHAAEMGNTSKAPPFFFTKPADAVIAQVDADAEVRIPYPPSTSAYDYEVELVVAVGKDVPSACSSAEALGSVFGYAVGLDMTRRDLQKEAKAKGRPWDLAKGADGSAPISILRRVSDIGHPSKGSISLVIGDKEKQRGDLSEMIWPVGDTLVYLSKFVQLRAGDLIFTGTPSGVGPVNRGETMDACIEGVGRLTVTI